MFGARRDGSGDVLALSVFMCFGGKAPINPVPEGWPPQHDAGCPTAPLPWVPTMSRGFSCRATKPAHRLESTSDSCGTRGPFWRSHPPFSNGADCARPEFTGLAAEETSCPALEEMSTIGFTVGLLCLIFSC